MKDSELRALVLKKFYDRRREESLALRSTDFEPPIPENDIMAVCDQLHEIGLLDWKAIKHAGVTFRGYGKINARGVDVIETDGKSAPVEFSFPMNQNFTFNSPANVQVGSNNNQNVVQTFNGLIERIDSSAASPAEKADAKSKLRAFLEHPLMTAIAGGIASSITGLNQN